MKTYRLSFADTLGHKPEHADRTACKSGTGMDMDCYYQVWPSRVAMARSIRMQQKRSPKGADWRACVKLTDGEGY